VVRKIEGTFFTERQLEILKLRANGLSIDEISRKLGISKADVCAILRKVEDIVERARRTLKLYAEIVGGRTLVIAPGTSLEEAVRMIFVEADLFGVKLSMSSAKLLIELVRSASSCIDFEEARTKCTIVVEIRRDGSLTISASRT